MTGNFCDIAKPFRPTKAEAQAMTTESKQQVVSHNLKGAKLCGWKP